MNILHSQFGTGANIDTRSDQEKENDYLFQEIVTAANPVSWVEKKQSEWRSFPIYDQDGSGSCVAQTLAKLLGVMYWLKNKYYVHFSATHIYQRRNNKPQYGMNGVNAFDIARKGVTLEELAPSQKMTDAQMDSVQIAEYKERVGEIFKISNYIQSPIKDIDTTASIIQTTGKSVMVWFYFKIDEWTNSPIVKYPDLDLCGYNTLRHSVAAVDYCLVNGKKSLIIEDSWGSSYGLKGQRVIDEEFFAKRNWFAAYPMNFSFDVEQTIPKPHYKFTKVMGLAYPTNEEVDVKALQNILKYEGLFPANTDSTGYYGSITAKAVLAFQRKYKVVDELELVTLAGKRVGDKTLAKLNELYGQ